MKRIFFVLCLILLVFAVGCSQPKVDDNDIGDVEDDSDIIMDDPAADKDDDPVIDKDDEPESCDSDLPPQQLKMIRITDLRRESDGFSFKLLLRNEADSENVLVEGNAAVVVYTTRIRNGKFVGDDEIYRKGVRFKQDMVAPDCTYPRIKVEFDDYDQDLLEDVLDEDLGILHIDLSFIGGLALETDYYPEGTADRLMP
ncbi:hypothetical protein JW968_02885 [Candidatus Woesearchaeota archaeon]|nr:hypothetical protein [Candidatus Woesearchaeota archaeon]